MFVIAYLKGKINDGLSAWCTENIKDFMNYYSFDH